MSEDPSMLKEIPPDKAEEVGASPVVDAIPEKAMDPESGEDQELLSKTSIVGTESKPALRELAIEAFFLKTPITFNPAVSLIGLVPLWGLTGFCIGRPTLANDLLANWFDSVIELFTWFYIVANPVLTFFIFWVAYRFGDIKLGKKDAEPEFSNATYFAMIFSAGVGVGLFFYGVSEPLAHRTSNYYAEAGYRSQNEIDQYALVITLYHWGFAGWSPYLIVAIASGLATYRFGLPMSIRSTFYPILGDYCWGWIGDLIDGYSIVMTVAGVCTSLGLGTMQIATGLQDLGWIDNSKENESLTTVYVVLICVITLIATISVVSGLSNGIKTLANIAFWLGNFILFLCFVMEKSSFLLNLLVQSTGVFLQYNLFKVPFWTDAFGALPEGEGRAVDDNSSAVWFIGGWSVFYMAWWVAWACFVGLFIARISKNRTLREIILSVFICPTIYVLIWFSFMGGIGLRQQRQALELQKIGSETYGDSEFFVTSESEFCYNVPQEDVVVNGTTIFTNALPGVTPVCDEGGDRAWFNVMNSFSYPDSNGFGGFGPFLSILSIITLVIYFVTSSDSGSLVVDILASNGSMQHHWIQRVFWAVTEGAVACALLVAGGSSALKSLQTASIVFGLPFNLFLLIMCMTITGMCKAIENEQNPDEPDPKILLPQEVESWSMPIFGGIFNIFETIFSVGFVHESRKEKGMHLPTMNQMKEFFVALLLPFVSVYRIHTSAIMDPKQRNKVSNILVSVAYAVSYIGWIILFCFGVVNYGFVALGWLLFVINTLLMMKLRMKFRNTLGIRGNVAGDFIASSFLYPQGLSQMVIELNSENASSHLARGHDD
uniref:Uncharacterized protein n=2 Tax=Pseudo-nitzschia australis TaxID=44445 RepID=A0A7S4AUD7_9STRA|eukprot:CAMPEP_0168189850 /NCGR_PEP_ID=MMETSP0139_2-20121125/16586_1 /TAXON_ID=44445 /ORGANISM="Pseudo-nitzschia australis, Strain 10249 10 AB" /LENGTH=829 /DNA_ID=CAMNT_0008112753 /DNA_START=116 /DNA_END=2605 /DNA_ORIENTATION=+